MSDGILIVTANFFSDLTLFSIDNHHFILQHHAPIFIPATVGKMDLPIHLLSHLPIEVHSSVNLCPLFYLKAYVCCTEPSKEKELDFVRPLSS